MHSLAGAVPLVGSVSMSLVIGAWAPVASMSVSAGASAIPDAVCKMTCTMGSFRPLVVRTSIGHPRSVSVVIMRSRVGLSSEGLEHDSAMYSAPSGPVSLTATGYVLTTPFVAACWLTLHYRLTRVVPTSS